MRMFKNLKIKSQMLLTLLIMATLCVGTGAVGLMSMLRYNDLASKMENASARAITGERVNGLILAVVMDSRGIYMSTTIEDVEKFAKPLLANLQKMRELMAEWKGLMPEGEEADLDTTIAAVEEFIKYRTELVRIARHVGFAEARAYGDNETNRANRKGLNDLIVGLAERNNQAVSESLGAMGHFFEQQKMVLIALLAGVMPLIIIFTYMLSIKLTVRPISAITQDMRKLADGDLEIRIQGLGNTNEIGEMADAVEIFRGGLIEAKKLSEAEKEAVKAKVIRSEALEKLIREFDTQIEDSLTTISSSSTELEVTAQTLSAMAEESSRTATSVAAASEEATTNVQAVAEASQRMNESISNIITDMNVAQKATSGAAEEAQATTHVVEGLLEATRKIDDVVGIIQDIAAQTNLLALNATIEAARAGEMGKGFAVVANEVKNLATQTANSTEEIAQQVASVQMVSTNVVSAINKICGTIQSINEMSSSVTQTMEAQGAVTQEILSNIVEAAQGTKEVSVNITNVSQGAIETGEASQNLLVAASGIARQSTNLRDQVQKFLSTVKTI